MWLIGRSSSCLAIIMNDSQLELMENMLRKNDQILRLQSLGACDSMQTFS